MNNDRCKSCGNEISEQQIFCGECGAKNEKDVTVIENNCKSCGCELVQDQVFCGECGTKKAGGGVEQPPPPMQAPPIKQPSFPMQPQPMQPPPMHPPEVAPPSKKGALIAGIVSLVILGGVGAWFAFGRDDTPENGSSGSGGSRLENREGRESDSDTDANMQTEPDEATSAEAPQPPPPPPQPAPTPSPEPDPTPTPTPEPTPTPTPTPEVRVAVSDVEGEILKIREIWTESRGIIDNRGVQATGSNDVKTYLTGGRTRNVDVRRGTNNIDYARIYMFYDDELIFAYWTGSEDHRLYFKNEQLFRWRRTVSGNITDFDNRSDLAEYLEWERRAFQDIEDLRIS